MYILLTTGVRMRRSAAPSRTACGAPPTKRPKFHTPFTTSSRGDGSSEEIVTMDLSASPESVNHQCVSSLDGCV